MNGEYEDVDYAFRHHLHSTILLLQGDPSIAALLDKSKDGITEADVDRLRNYNIDLFERVKMSLANLHTYTIKVTPPPEA